MLTKYDMHTFATEFPVRNIDDKATFVAQILGWLRGNEKSTVLDTGSERFFDADFSELAGKNDETLSLENSGTDKTNK